MMKKIFLISPQPTFGGAATANISIAKMLINEGYDVTYNDEYMDLDIYSGVIIDHTPIHQLPNKNKSLQNFILKNGYDAIIWGDISLFIYFISSLKKFNKMKIKQYAIFHSLSLDQNIKSLIIENVVAFSLRYIDTFIFVSDYTRSSWLKYRKIRSHPEKLVVIHNPMALPESVTLNFNSSSNFPRIGFVGRFSDEKQPELFCMLSDIDDNNYYVAFGDGPLLNRLREKYMNVKFMGSCNNVDEIYSNIDILLMTSKFENCPMVILEAKARGIPCVAPNVGGIPEIVESGVDGVLYDDYDPETILFSINRILSNYQKISSNCESKAKLFDPKVLVKDWIKIL